MDVEITLKNYRCFSDQPATFRLREGAMTAFIGVNNAGKSTVLRFFHELSGLFNLLGNLGGGQMTARSDQPQGINFKDVANPLEVFHGGNDRPMTIDMMFRPDPSVTGQANAGAVQIVSTIPRGGSAQVRIHDVQGGAELVFDNGALKLADGTGTNLDLTEVLRVCRELSNAFYVGPARHVVGVGGGTYYSMLTGSAFIAEWARISNNPDQRHMFKPLSEFKRTLATMFGFQNLDIRPSDSKHTFIITADDEQLRLEEMGGGFAQVFHVLGSALLLRPEPYILIDEPELGLHPSL